MQNDDVIWQLINKDVCSFRVKTLREDLCRNEYNVTGKCNRVSCPLANSNYGTVVETQGHLFLCLKTVERAHLPRSMWERIKLPFPVDQAKNKIEQEMKNICKSHQIERCKRRAVKLVQMLDRMRRMEVKIRERHIPVKKKTDRREATRERKAEVAARLEDVIELELMRRLQQGVYGRLYDVETSTRAEEERAIEGQLTKEITMEKRGYVTVEQEGDTTDDEELLDTGEDRGGDDTPSDGRALDDLRKFTEGDVEDLACSLNTTDALERFTSANRISRVNPSLSANRYPTRKYGAEASTVVSGREYNFAARKRPRFFKTKRHTGVRAEMPAPHEDEVDVDCSHDS